jgi:predicted CXXCH cytochrome family protein
MDFTKTAFVHGPVAVGACIVCHKPHSSSEPKLLVQDAKSLCLTCHAEVQAKGEEGMHMHGALEQGCTRCHDPHASDHRFQLRESAPKLCLQCHQEKFDQITADAKVVHGAVTAEGGCTVCHEPHSSRLESLQRGTQPGTCLVCHDKTLKSAQGGEIANMAALLKANPDWHGPIREGACTACHNPHAGKNFRMLTEDYPPQFYAPFQIDTFKLCFKCHIPDLVLKASGQGLTQFRDGDKNLHWLHVNQEKGRTCRACHEVHASKRPAHIREAVPFGTSGWLLELNFEQTAEGGRCSPGCHVPRSYDRGRPSPPRGGISAGGSR